VYSPQRWPDGHAGDSGACPKHVRVARRWHWHSDVNCCSGSTDGAPGGVDLGVHGSGAAQGRVHRERPRVPRGAELREGAGRVSQRSADRPKGSGGADADRRGCRADGLVEEAVKTYRYALVLDEKQTTARAHLARIMVVAGVPDQALELLEPGLALAPDSPDLLAVRPGPDRRKANSLARAPTRKRHCAWIRVTRTRSQCLRPYCGAMVTRTATELVRRRPRPGR